MEPNRDALVSYLKIFTWMLLGVAFLPFDFMGGKPIWPWLGILDGQWADVLAVIAPFLGALLFFVLSRTRWPAATLAFWILGALTFSWLVTTWSALSAYSLDVFGNLGAGLPALFSRSMWLTLLGMILLAAGVRLSGKGYLEQLEGQPRPVDSRKASVALISAGILLVLLFYLLPHRGSVPLIRLVKGISVLADHLDSQVGIVLFINQSLSLGPLLLALASCYRLLRRAPARGGFLVVVLVGYLPLLVLVIGLRNIVSIPVLSVNNLRSFILLLALTTGAGLSIAALVRGLWFDVPWSMGPLNRTDEVILQNLSQPDPEDAWKKSKRKLHPLVLPFVNRRLHLWRTAAGESAGDQDPIGLLGSRLEERWREENLQDQMPEEPGMSGETQEFKVKPPRASWPDWMTGHRLTGTAVGVLVLGLGLTWLSWSRPAANPEWNTGGDNDLMARIFEEEIPSVISQMSYREGDIEDLASFGTLDSLLEESESSRPGLRSLVLDLLELGRKGRYRLHDIYRARDRLNQWLQQNEVPYFVRSRVRYGNERDLFYLLIYRVADYRRFKQKDSGRDFLVLHLVRADSLGVVESHMGFADEEEFYVHIIFDRLGEFMNDTLLDVLDRQDEIGDLARQGLTRAGIEVDPLLATEEWTDEDELEEEADEDDLDEEAEPEKPSIGQDSQAKLSAMVLSGLTRHELYHRWQGVRPEPPAALWGWLHDYEEDSVRSVAAELGAYLGECSRHPAYARLKLAVMLDSLENPRMYRNLHGMARTFLLAKILDVQLSGPRQWQTMSVGAEAYRLLDMTDEELDAKLANLHAEYFESEVPVFEPVPVVSP